MKNTSLILLLGSNKGDRLRNIENAIERISSGFTPPRTRSSYYLSEAWGNRKLEPFLNLAIHCDAIIKPIEILIKIKKMEQRMGRDIREHWQSRTIDIDIAFYGDCSFRSPRLNVPHLLLHQRRFALTPLADIIPTHIHPVYQKSISELLEECEDPLQVKKIKNQP